MAKSRQTDTGGLFPADRMRNPGKWTVTAHRGRNHNPAADAVLAWICRQSRWVDCIRPFPAKWAPPDRFWATLDHRSRHPMTFPQSAALSGLMVGPGRAIGGRPGDDFPIIRRHLLSSARQGA
jgi:hypothetical protein